MNQQCANCLRVPAILIECCNGHRFCQTCLESELHGSKFTCHECGKEKCSSYYERDGKCFSCCIGKEIDDLSEKEQSEFSAILAGCIKYITSQY